MTREDAAWEAWREEHLDRNGNKRLTREPDPDRVKRHLDGVPDKRDEA